MKLKSEENYDFKTNDTFEANNTLGNQKKIKEKTYLEVLMG